MGSLHKNIQLMLECLMLRSGAFTFPTIHDFPDDVICNIAINARNTTLYSKRDQASDL